jgi:hypothetical protein
MRLHFRTISTNSPHPLAAHACLELREPEVTVGDTSFTMTLYDSIYLMISKPEDYRLDGKAFAMNWKTGEMVLVRPLTRLKISSEAISAT